MAIPLIAALMGMMGGAGMQMGMSAPPVGRTLAYVTNAAMPNLRPDMTQAIELYHRNIIDRDTYLAEMKKQGAEQDLAIHLSEIARPLLGVGELITLYRRGAFPLEVLSREMQRLGYTPTDIGRLLTVTQFFPQPADLVRFAVREVYTPEVRARYGMDEDFPPEFLQESAKAGMTEDQAKNYWASHWELPSLNMGYEMLHRRVITPQDLETLLRTQDVMPFWRDKLTQISYSPFTRVDVRRMYRDGVLTRKEVFDSYRDIGYDDWRAEKLTEWTVAESQGTERDLTRTMILDGYEQGQVTRPEAAEYLERLKYDPEEAEFILTLKDNDIAEAEQKEQIQVYQAQYRNGLTTDQEFRAQLDALDIRATYRDKVYHTTVRERQRLITLPTRQDIDTWFMRGIIDLPKYIAKMKQIGYASDDIQAYVKSMNKLPNRKELTMWLYLELIDIPTWRQYMMAIGYSEKDTDLFLSEIRSGLGEV